MAGGGIPLYVRVAADVSALRANFAEAVAQLETTKRQMQQTVAAFDGSKIIGEASAMAKVIHDLGGASKLTEAEQRRVNATVTEALAKYKALGREAPQALKELEQATQRVEEPTGLLMGKMIALGSAVGSFVGNLGSQAVRALADWGREALNSAGTIADLSNKTGLSMKAIQEMQYVADQTGTTLDTMTRAAFMLGTRLADGKDSVVDAVARLGLNFKDIQALSPEEQFNRVVDALQGMASPQERNNLALQVFGKSAAEILPAVVEGYRDIANQARISSDGQIQALDAATDRWTQFKTNTMATIRSALGSTVLAFDSFVNKIKEAAVVSAGGVKALEAYRAEQAKLAQTKRETAEAVAKARQQTAEYETAALSATRAVTGKAAALRLLNEQLARARDLERGSDMVVSFGFDPAVIRRQFQQAFPDEEMWNLGAKVGTQVSEGIYSALPSADGMFQIAAKVGTQVSQGIFSAFPVDVIEHQLGKGGSVWGRIFGGAQGLLGDMNRVFTAAFEGGGGVGGAFKSLATNALSSLMSIIPGIGPFLSQFAGAIMAGLSKLGGWFKSLFGGPDKMEVEGRKAAASFRDGVIQGLSEAGLTEAMAAVANGADERWAKFAISLRERFIQAGYSAEQAGQLALEWADKIWRAEKAGSAVVIQNVKELNGLLENGTTAAIAAVAEEGKAAVVEVAKTIEERLATVWGVAYRASGGAGITDGSGGPDDEPWSPEAMRQFLLNNGYADAHRFAANWAPGSENANKAQNQYANWAADSHAVKDSEGKVLYVTGQTLMETAQRLEREAKNERQEVAGFDRGTPGLGFVDFGPRGTLAMLHNREAVVPKGKEREFAERHGVAGADMRGVESRLDRLERTMERTLSSMPRMLRDALAGASV